MTDKTKLTLIRMMCKTYCECYADHEENSEILNLLIDLIYNVTVFQEEEKMAKFQYEHPDLVREGITWTGKPGYITPVPDPARPDPVAAVETPKIIIPQDDVSYRPVPGWHRKECKYCGKAFWAKYGTRKYCQEDCYKVGNRADARRAYNAAHPEKQEQRYCVICRKPIPLDMSRSYKTCGDPECKEELAEQSKKAWYRQRKEKVQ